MPLSASNQHKRVVLGRIVGAFGIDGWVKVESFTDPPSNVLKYLAWQVCLRGEWRVVKLLLGKVTAKGVLAKLEGVADRTEAQQWRGGEIAVDRSELPTPPAGEYYWADLVGLEASTPEGALLGKVKEIVETPAHALLVIDESATEGGEVKRHWVPLVAQRLKSVDLTAGRLTVDWQPDW